MSAADSIPRLPATRGLFLIAMAAAILLAGGAVLAPSAVAKGWLTGFVFWSSAPIGATALALIHETTGGRWGVAAAPTLRLGCLCALILPLFFAVFAPFVGLVYPWARDVAPIAPDVSRLFLNATLFAVYGLIALVGWAVIAALLAAGRLGLLGVSLALVFHGVAISAVAVAWLLSLDPRFADSAFGAEIAVQQILLALAAVALIAPSRAIAVANGDIGALLFATALGAFYLGLMTFIVKWYGDQPDDAAWYLARAHGLPFAFLLGSLALGAAVPIVYLRVGARPGERASDAGRWAQHDAGRFCSRSLAGERGKRLGRPCGGRRRRCDGRPVAGARPGARPAICSPATARGESGSTRGADVTAGRNSRREARGDRLGSVVSTIAKFLLVGALAVVGAFFLAAPIDRRPNPGRGTISPTPASESHVPDEAREPPDIRAGTVAAILAGFLLFVVCAASGLVFFYRSRAHDATFVKVENFPAPRLQTLADGLAEPEIARQKADLERFRWLDSDHRAFQIPIEDAMRLVAARGAKAYDPVPGVVQGNAGGRSTP